MTGGQGSRVVNGRGSEARSPGASPASVQGLLHPLTNSKVLTKGLVTVGTGTASGVVTSTATVSQTAVVMSRQAAVTPVPSTGTAVPLQPGMQLVNMRPGQIAANQGRSLAPRMILSQQVLQGVRPGQVIIIVITVLEFYKFKDFFSYNHLIKCSCFQGQGH